MSYGIKDLVYLLDVLCRAYLKFLTNPQYIFWSGFRIAGFSGPTFGRIIWSPFTLRTVNISQMRKRFLKKL